MALTPAALQAMGDHLASVATMMSLHLGDPGTTGINETTATRMSIGWSATTAAGDLSISGPINFTGGANGGPCQYVGLWNTAGTMFYGGFALTGDLTFNSAGAYTVNDLDITGTAS